MKKFLLFFLPLIAIVMLSVTSCSKDDDNDPTMSFDKSTIVGTWTINSVSGTSVWRWIAEGKQLTFNSNGTCVTEFSMEPMLVYSLISVDGAVYTVKVNGTLDESDKSVIIKMKK
jgi:hypothetical protein